jgi:hypothetical protein
MNILAHVAFFLISQCGQTGLVIAQNHDGSYTIIQTEEQMIQMAYVVENGEQGKDYEIMRFNAENDAEVCQSI